MVLISYFKWYFVSMHGRLLKDKSPGILIRDLLAHKYKQHIYVTTLGISSNDDSICVVVDEFTLIDVVQDLCIVFSAKHKYTIYIRINHIKFTRKCIKIDAFSVFHKRYLFED